MTLPSVAAGLRVSAAEELLGDELESRGCDAPGVSGRRRSPNLIQLIGENYGADDARNSMIYQDIDVN